MTTDTGENRNMPSNQSYSFVAKTVQSGMFKTTMEALKEIINDGNFVLDDTGIRLTAVDLARSVMVSMRMEGPKFEHYECSKRMIIGVNTSNMCKALKTVTNNDILTLFMETDDPDHLGIKIENEAKNSITTFKMNLLDIDQEEHTLSAETFESIITLPSSDFQKLIKDMHSIGDVVDIRSVGQQLILSCEGDFASQETVIGENESGMKVSIPGDTETAIVQGLFCLKYLVLFTKCTNLSTQCSILMKNNFPLVVGYQIANLGTIRLLTVPHVPQRARTK